jgi:hypothetical protein
MIYPLASRLRVIQDAGDRTSNLQRQVITKLDIPDNVATPLFTVTTANEDGSADGGAYLCRVTALIAHAGTSETANAATKAFQARFTRAMTGAGSGALSAVTEDYDNTPADTDAPARSIGNVTLTVAEMAEFVVTASITVDLTASEASPGPLYSAAQCAAVGKAGGAEAAVDTAEVVALVELFWTGFLTTPEIAPG